MDGGRATKPGETARFGRRREDVIHAASALINELGVKGTTFAELARSVGLNATSITYYFDRKDKLVVAVFASTLDWLEEAARDAAALRDPQDRLRAFIAAHVGLRRRIRLGEKGLITALSEIRTLDEDAQAPLLEQYGRVVDHVRSFFGDNRTGGKFTGDFCRGRAHCAHGHAEHDELGPGNRLGGSIADRVHQPALVRPLPHVGIRIVACRRGAGQALAHREPDRTAQQPESDHRDARECHPARSAAAARPHDMRAGSTITTPSRSSTPAR
mgnify:CR=1 FL=1